MTRFRPGPSTSPQPAATTSATPATAMRARYGQTKRSTRASCLMSRLAGRSGRLSICRARRASWRKDTLPQAGRAWISRVGRSGSGGAGSSRGAVGRGSGALLHQVAHLAADRPQAEDRKQAVRLVLQHHLGALVPLREFHDGLGRIADLDVVAVRYPGLVEKPHRGLEHPHARVAMEIPQVPAAEEARDVLRERTLDVEQVDMRRLLAVARDRLLGR